MYPIMKRIIIPEDKLKMKRRLRAAAAVMAAAAFAVTAVLLIYAGGRQVNSSRLVQNPETLNIEGEPDAGAQVFNVKEGVPADRDGEPVLFIMGEREGKVAVLSPDRRTAYDVLDVYVDTLPPYDAALLRAGIEVRSAAQLYALIEDYSS